MKFQNTFCSQCGGEFGPGDHGYSHCKDHSVFATHEEDEAFDELDNRINRVLEHWTPLTPMTQAEINKRWGSWMTMYVRMVEEAHGIK